MKKIISICFLMSVLIFSASTFAGIKVGDAAPDFNGLTTTGEKISLAKFKGKFVVIEWFNPACPFTGKQYNSKNMQTLQKNYTSKDAIWISVNTDQSNAIEKQSKKLNEWVKSVGAAASYYVIDNDATIASLYQAKTTPHMFVINPEGTLIYSGAIDDKRSADVEDIASAKNYVSTALDQSMAGKDVEIKSTRPYGCSVKYK